MSSQSSYTNAILRMKIRVLLSLFLLSTCALRSTPLEIVTGSFVDLEVMESASPDVTSLRVTGEAPRFILRPLGGAALSPNQQVLSFDYFCPDGVRSVYVLYSRNVDSGWDASKSVYGGSLGRAEAWQPFASDLKAGSSGKWSHEFQAFIIQMEMPLGTEIQLRNFAVLDGSGSKGLGAEIGMERKFQEAEAIDAYLNANYTNAEINCAISENQVGVLGSGSTLGAAIAAEPPMARAVRAVPVRNSDFIGVILASVERAIRVFLVRRPSRSTRPRGRWRLRSRLARCGSREP
mgnify:CR=1 FL=1